MTITNQTAVAQVASQTKDELLAMTPEVLVATLGGGNKSQTIRVLTARGEFTTSQIAKMLDIRYQFVRNVQKEPVRKGK